MPSLRARLVDFALPLLGVKSFFSEPDKMDKRIAAMREKAPERPRGKWHKRFAIEETTSRGFPVVTFTPKGGATAGAPHLFYLHGGGYVMDIASIHWETIGKLCEALGASATVPIYPLAPEATLEETLPAMRELYDKAALQHGAHAITLMGDSAGAGMALALSQELAKDEGPQPASLVLYSPWLDATASAEGQAAIEPRDRMLSQVGLTACGMRYAGDNPLSDPRISPLFGTLDALPPIAQFAGTHDILVVDARRMAKALEAAGRTDDVFHEYDGLFHDFMLFPIPEGGKALGQTVEFIRLHHARHAA